MCFNDFFKVVILQFCHNVKFRGAAAPRVFDSLFLNWHSVINNIDIVFKFRNNSNGQNRDL